MKRQGFTLVELLVVITILAMLAGIGTVAALTALNRGKEARFQVEISGLDMAMKEYKNRYGAYPPIGGNLAAVQFHLAKAFPQNKEATTATGPALLQRIVDMNEAQQLVFWLRGFASNPQYPLTGDGNDATPAERQPIFEFDKARLAFPDGTQGPNEGRDDWTKSGTAATAPWYVPKDGEGTPYVVFVSKNYGGFTAASVDLSAAGKGIARPYCTAARVGTTTPPKYCNPDSFQIITAGLDGLYGDAGPTTDVIYPAGDNYSEGDLDNLTNFAPGSLENQKP